MLPDPTDVRRIPPSTARRVFAAFVAVLVVVAAMFSAQVLAPADRAAAADALRCDQNTLYAINSAGRTVAINITTGGVTDLTSMSPAYNGLGVTNNGIEAWAYDGNERRITRYDSVTGATNTYTGVDPNAPTGIIRGAINPATGVFYYGGGGTSAYLGAFDTRAGTPIGQVGTITGLTSGNGDFAFSTGGLMFVVASNTVVRVNNPTIPTTAGTVSLSTSLVATLPTNTNSPGIAFSTDGYLYVSSGSQIIQLDPASGARVRTFDIQGGFQPTDLASCNYPNTVSVQKNVVDRVQPNDQFSLSVTGGDIASGNTATTAGSATGVQPQVAGAALAIPQRVYTITETASGSTRLDDYVTTWSCENVNVTGAGRVIETGIGTTGEFTFPAAVSADGTDIVCTFTNTPKDPTLSLTQELASDRYADDDQFTVAVRGTSPTGGVLNPTDQSTTGGSGSTIAAGTGATGTVTGDAGTTYYLTASASANGSKYMSTITCTDARDLQQDLPTDASFTGSLAITPVAGAQISCVVTSRLVPAELSLAKTNPSELTVGVESDYVLTVTNNGGEPAASATVADLLPEQLQYVGATGATCEPEGQLVTCTVDGPIPAGESASFTLSVMPTTAAAGTSVSNSAVVDPTGGNNSGDPDGCEPASTCAVTPPVTVGNGVDLSLEKTNPESLVVGVESDYTFTVTNGGTGPAASATVADQLPEHLEFVSASGADCSADGQLVTCAVPGPIAANGGTASFTITVLPAAAAADTSVSNAAAVDPTGGNEPGDPDACDTTGTPDGCAVTPELPVGNGVNLSLEKSNPAHLVVGVESDYTFTVTNSGTGPAESAMVADRLPENLRFVSATDAECSAVGQLVTCEVPGPIAANGGTASFTVTVLPTAAAADTSVSNAAAVDSTGGNEPGDPDACATEERPAGCAVTPEIPVGNGVDLSLEKTNPVSMTVDVAAEYTLTVTNNGTGPATSATVADLLPEGLVFNGSVGADCVADGQLLTCAVPGEIEPNGGTAIFTISVTPTAEIVGAEIVNRATVDPTGGGEPVDPGQPGQPGGPDGCEASDTCAVTPPIAVVTAALLLEKHAEPIAPATIPVKVGDQIGFSFLVTNTSEVTVDELRIDDPMLDEVTCDTTVLAPNESTNCFGGPVEIDQADLDAGSLVNTATASARLPGCVDRDGVDCPIMVTSPASSATVPTDSFGAMTAEKTAVLDDANTDGRANAGEQIHYTVTVTNTGTVTLENVEVDDPLLPLVCETDTVAPGAAVDCTGTYTVTEADETAGEVLNVATARADGPQGQLVESDPSGVTVEAGAAASPLPTTGADPSFAATAVLMLLLGGAGMYLFGRPRHRLN